MTIWASNSFLLSICCPICDVPLLQMLARTFGFSGVPVSDRFVKDIMSSIRHVRKTWSIWYAFPGYIQPLTYSVRVIWPLPPPPPPPEQVDIAGELSGKRGGDRNTHAWRGGCSCVSFDVHQRNVFVTRVGFGSWKHIHDECTTSQCRAWGVGNRWQPTHVHGIAVELLAINSACCRWK